MKNNMKLIMENWRKSQKVLNENESTVTYSVDIDADLVDDPGKIDKYVEISLPSGEPKHFVEIVKDLVGKELYSAVEDERFVFSLDPWGPTLPAAVLNIMQNGPIRFFIEEWARLNGYSVAAV